MPNLPDIPTLADDLGGVLENYAPVEDPVTDLDAGFDNSSRCNIAMMSHTAPRSWARITLAATTGALVLVAHDAMWGNALAVAPALARTSAGIFTLTYPATVDDELGDEHTVNFRDAWANHRLTSAALFLNVVRTSANVLTLYVRDAAGALTDSVGTNVAVFAI